VIVDLASLFISSCEMLTFIMLDWRMILVIVTVRNCSNIK